MNRKRLWTAVVCAASMAFALCVPASADSSKVVTLGANLTQEQQDMMMRYFNASYDEVQIITVNNDDERERLSAYVPLEQIGTRTYSCAYVQPTESGGIRVKTANLSWVTCNMIATTLSTSGVTNCDVVAASPFLVSGTGALTGIIMAYETATGEELPQEKKDLATEELVVTGDLGDRIGQKDATAIVNEAKMDVLEEDLQDQDLISGVVEQAAEDNGYELTDEEVEVISGLMEKIAQQDYDYESMRDTLEMVADNVSDTDLGLEVVEEETEASEETTETAPVEEVTEGETEALEEVQDSILDLVDDSALGEDVISGSTDEKETEAPIEEVPQETEALLEEIPVESEVYTEAPATEAPATEAPVTEAPATEAPATEAPVTEAPATEAPATEAPVTEAPATEAPATEAPVTEAPATEAPATEAPVTEAPATEAPVTEAPATELATEAPATELPAETETEGLNPDQLSAEDREDYDALVKYCDDVFNESETKEDGTAKTAMDTDTAEKVKAYVENLYLSVKLEGIGDYVPEGGALYVSDELNYMDSDLQDYFLKDTENLFGQYSEEERQAVYDDVMLFLAELYGELPEEETETVETAQTEALEALEMPEAESELLVPETSGLEEAAPLETLE
ncbi:MAG TPA: DUF1002 domain-containing protein [Candidatus Limivivens intestinipullorum]|uniref:DUF1002 domain-containing protein n=1 Tax=Candidatus Limivivens intestinipullorum TaxID=2840858 RepID=A0A9D1JK72_9FIRM|nr:DUF1002 domain-containing protein [Candidatus Limivivens intestinipullorum]